jgi:hypothetical protein
MKTPTNLIRRKKMFKNHVKFFLAVPIFVIAVLCAFNIATANPITDTFTDISGQGYDPGNITLIAESGGRSFINDDTVSVVWSYTYGVNYDLRVNITNTSTHTMSNTILAFEQSAFNWKANTLALNTWDGLDSSNDAAYWFGNIAPGNSSVRYIDVKYGEPFYLALGLSYNSLGLDTGITTGSDVSITYGPITQVPEPASFILFVTGGALFAGRRYLKRKTT